MLPAVERSAALAFLEVPGLEWVTSHDVTPDTVHAEALRAGLSWVAVCNEAAVVGFVIAEEYDDAVHVLELSVAREAQGRGAGTQLVKTVIADARERGKMSVTLTTFLDLSFNEQFYQKSGFVRIPNEAMPARLQAALEYEKSLGLPRNRRCAMRLAL
ncbi:acetyltransferase [Acetobacter oeni LMG 21952]|nr:acetyltransferase [Acetobacter oeni LMG 21952]